MSAQINSINDLLAATMNAKTVEAQAEAQRAEAAKAAARQVLATYIEQTLPDVLRLLNFTLDDFHFGDTIDGWQATIEWQQEIDGERYPLSLAVTTGQAAIGIASTTRAVAHAWLKPGPQDPVDALGQFLVDVPVRWREYQEREGDRALGNLTKRLNRASDIDALLAIAAAADEDELLRPEDRAGLRAEIAKEIRIIRNEERAKRAHSNARLIYAVEIIELAQAYVEEYAWYELACYDWAVAWTRELWDPCELYKVRYVPAANEPIEHQITQQIVIVENPDTLELGRHGLPVTEVTPQGQIAKRWIGAFLDAKPVRWDKPLITDRYMYHTALRAGDYYVNIPPADLLPVDIVTVDVTRPIPPDRWHDWLRDHYQGNDTLAVPAIVAEYSHAPVPMDAFDVARMTPAEFLDNLQTNL